ncbi:MAG: pentapeptide repeat-containing protein [Paracoccaceae bacterium]|nr:pentapeptide repeat-containing protein [Paracoccaceae bacterium]
MKPLAQAFLKQEKWKNFEFKESPIDLGHEIFEGANFLNHYFDALLARGCTFKNSYFTKCSFHNCDFSNSEFSSCTFDDCKFVNCEFGNLDFLETRCAQVEFSTCSAESISLQGGSFVRGRVCCCNFLEIIGKNVTKFDTTFEEANAVRFDFEGTFLAISFEQCRNVELSANGGVPNISASTSSFKEISIRNYLGPSIRLRDCEVLTADFGGPSKGLVLHAYNSLIFGPDLEKVDLIASTLPGCSIINGNWPNQDGKTNWIGRFVPPDNLLAEPVDDVMGLSETVRRNISRSQALASLEQEKSISVATFVLHRIVGLTTGHGRSPARLLCFALLPATLLSVLHVIYVQEFGPFVDIENPASLSEFVSLFWMYFSLVVGYGDRSSLALLPTLESVAWVLSVLFLGLVVTLFSNFLFRQG